MSTLAAALRARELGQGPLHLGALYRWTALLLLAALIAATAGQVPAALEAAADAYLEIAVFVAFTLLLVYGAEAGFKTELGTLLRRHAAWQVPIGALLGAFPGCGGAIVAVTQFTRGHMSFGGLVATLSTTMGDAMFLLIAAEPMTALLVSGISLAVGVASGYLIDGLHGRDFLRPAQAARQDRACIAGKPWIGGRQGPLEWAWIALMAVAMVVGIPAAMAEADLLGWLGLPEGAALTLALAGAGLGLLLWARDGDPDEQDNGSAAGCRPIARSVIQTTNFVLAWVVFAMVGYELLVAALGIDIEALLIATGPLVVALAILVGFIPGCGPQLVVTSLYLAGALPLSAQLGNAIANDGDALFPAIAIAPRAAVAATLYSALPALVVGYGAHMLGY
ncbi:MAG: putative manganese transporter [Kiloniellales bacterium]|nr:putative manganese transporter [Kiloniellales bacterium]